MAGDISINKGVEQLQDIVKSLTDNIKNMRDDLIKQLSEANDKIIDITRRLETQTNKINNIDNNVTTGFEQSTKDNAKLDLNLSNLADNIQEPAVAVPEITLPWR